MAKKPVAKPAASKNKNVPAVTKNKTNVPANADDMTKMMAADSGKGVSTKSSDNIVPLIYVLQAQSPQVLKQKQEFIKGSEAGDFWFRGTKEVNKELLVVLAHMSVEWVEWRPNRGGFVGRHGSERPAEATYVKDPKNPKKGAWELENGNYVAETREHALIVVDPESGSWSAYVLPLSGSNHGVARQWMTNAGRKRVPGTDDRAPLFGYAWKLTTVPKSNDDGDWFGLAVEDGGEEGEELLTWNLPNGPEIYRAARQLNADFETGKKTSEQADDIQDDDAGDESEESDI